VARPGGRDGGHRGPALQRPGPGVSPDSARELFAAIVQLALRSEVSGSRHRKKRGGRDEGGERAGDGADGGGQCDNRTIYRIRLEHFGFRVIEAADGESGIRKAREERPDVVLMDISIPLIDGHEATRILKADPAMAAIPIIALTAHAMAEDHARAAEAGWTRTSPSPPSPGTWPRSWNASWRSAVLRVPGNGCRATDAWSRIHTAVGALLPDRAGPPARAASTPAAQPTA
jgi:two-component system, cell cycle response regulator DivK